MVLICNIRDPVTGQNYSRDVRYVAQKAENYLVGMGTGDTAYFARAGALHDFPLQAHIRQRGWYVRYVPGGDTDTPRCLCASTFTNR